jgi:hypothetical protein
MALDRWITFEKDKPTREEVGNVLAEYVGPDREGIWLDGCGTDEKTVYTISIAGKPGWKEDHFRECPYREERFVEIAISGSQAVRVVDVITRQADPLTCAVADGLLEYLARRLDGTKGLLESP